MHLPRERAIAIGHIQRRIIGKFRHVRFAQHNRARTPEVCHDGRVTPGQIVRQRGATCRGVQARHIDVVLHQNGQAEKWKIARGCVFLQRFRFVQRLRIRLAHRIQAERLVIALNAPQKIFRQFLR